MDLQNAPKATVDHSSSGLGIVANGNCHVPRLNCMYPPTGQGLYFGAAQSGESPLNYRPRAVGGWLKFESFLAYFNCRPPFAVWHALHAAQCLLAPWVAAVPHAPSFRLTAGDVIANVHLAKDMTEGVTFARRLEVVEVGIGQDGDSKTTCVIVFVENGAVDDAAKIKAKSKKLAPQAVTALKPISQ
jgi:hypothetical protein